MKKSTKAASAAIVYCGPTIRGVAKQYTVFQNGLPAALEEAAQAKPAIRGLIVPLEKLPEAMRDLRNGSGSIFALYQSVAGQ